MVDADEFCICLFGFVMNFDDVGGDEDSCGVCSIVVVVSIAFDVDEDVVDVNDLNETADLEGSIFVDLKLVWVSVEDSTDDDNFFCAVDNSADFVEGFNDDNVDECVFVGKTVIVVDSLYGEGVWPVVSVSVDPL